MADAERRAGQPTIGFLGLGKMGLPMATNLALAGYDLKAWNRTLKVAKSLTDAGATITSEAPETVRGADIVITMLQTDAAVESVLFDGEIISAMSQGTVVVDMSSIPPHSAIDYANRLNKFGLSWLDAPVSGGTRGASEGSLTIMVGGSRKTFDRCAPILQPMGRVTHVGPVGAGQVAKIANQIIVATTIGGVAEALLLTVAAGLDPGIVQEALTGGFADSRVLKEHGRRMVDRDFVPGGTVEIQLKDLNIAMAEARELNLRLPLTEQVTALFGQMIDSGKGDIDHSGLILELERLNRDTSS